MTEREQWFKDRIGKRVYRSHNYCDCDTCKDILENGLLIKDVKHADYLAMVEGDYTAEGHKLMYFDTKEEAINYAKEYV